MELEAIAYFNFNSGLSLYHFFISLWLSCMKESSSMDASTFTFSVLSSGEGEGEKVPDMVIMVIQMVLSCFHHRILQHCSFPNSKQTRQTFNVSISLKTEATLVAGMIEYSVTMPEMSAAGTKSYDRLMSCRLHLVPHRHTDFSMSS